MTTEKPSIAFIGFYPEDWITGCRLLSPMAEWAYLQICLEIWDTGKPVEPRRIPRLLIRAGGDHQALIDELRDEGKITLDRQGRIINHRAIGAHRLSASLHEKRIKSAQNAAKKRWNSSTEKDQENKDKDAPRNAPRNAARNAPRNANENENENENERDSNESHPPIVPHEKQAPEQQDFLSPIPDKAWEKFEQYRREIEKPLTKVSRARARKLLTSLAEQGQDPAKVIQQTIDRAWVGLFEIKADNSEKKSGWRMPDE